MNDGRGRAALVTGATRNLGEGIARRLAREGFAVGVNGRDEGAGRAVVASIRDDGGSAFWIPGDVSDEEAARSAVASLRDEAGPIAVLVNNAGVRHAGAITELTTADWSRVLGTVLTGAFMLQREALPDMYAAGWGRVVNIAGVSGQMGAANRAPVVAAKGGLMALTKAVSLEAAPHGVTVNAVSPGLIDTARSPITGDAGNADAHYAGLIAQLPVGRPGRVEEVAALCAFLCSDEAGFITGQIYGINGGIYR